MTEIHSFSLTLLPERVKVCIGFPAQKRDCYLLIILRSSRLRRLGAFLRLLGAGEEAMGVVWGSKQRVTHDSLVSVYQ